MKRIDPKVILKNILQSILVTFTTIFITLCLRIFLFASFVIQSPSMSPALEPGDYIFVNKLIPGPRVYKSFALREATRVETYRFRGVRPVRRNDVLVFNFPYSDGTKITPDLNVVYVKRCIAIPGDTFYIDNGIYKVKNIADTLGYFPYQHQLSLRDKEDIAEDVYRCFPFDTTHYDWTIKYFGPLYVPKVGDDIVIDTVNYRLYKNLIEYETNQLVTVEEGKIFLDGWVLQRYRFRLNYYFMSGDWVFDSQDSRYWGLLPEDHIIGKATFIWQSKDRQTSQYKWKRFFKAIK